MADLYDMTSTLDGLRSDIEEAFGEMDELREKADKWDEIEQEFDDLDAVREKVSAYDEIESSFGDMSDVRVKLGAYDDLERENEAMKGEIESLKETNTRLQHNSEKHVRALVSDGQTLLMQMQQVLDSEQDQVGQLGGDGLFLADYAQRLVNLVAHLYVTTKVRQEEAA